MEVAHYFALICHFAGLALLLGGGIAGLSSKIAVDAVVVAGARLQLVSGLVLVGLQQATAPGEINHDKLLVKLGFTLLIAGLAEYQLRDPEDPVSRLAIPALSILTIAIAVVFYGSIPPPFYCRTSSWRWPPWPPLFQLDCWL